jgi:hypothetical protein
MNHVFLASILALASFSASLLGTHYFSAGAEAVVAEAPDLGPYDDGGPVAYASVITTGPDAPRIPTLRDSLDAVHAELRVTRAERSELGGHVAVMEVGGGWR